MISRKWLTALAVGTGLALGTALPASAADKTFTFGQMRTASVDAARAKAEAWLKSVGKMDKAAFDKIWAQEDQSILDRTAATLALGNEDARKLLAESQTASTKAPKAVPALLKDDKQNPYFRANLALAYARNLSNGRVYEEALETLNAVRAEDVIDPAAYLFHKAVAEHATLKKEQAQRTIVRLLDEVADAPERYRMLGTIMFVDMQGWKKEGRDLSNIARLMDNIERRLELARGGPVTQDLQKKVIFRLDELIKEKENQSKGGGQCNGGNCPKGGQAQPGGGNINPSSPAPDSGILGGAGPGNVDNKKLREYAQNWGKMNDQERARAMVDITRDLPPRYKAVIEDYFRSIAKAQQP